MVILLFTHFIKVKCQYVLYVLVLHLINVVFLRTVVRHMFDIVISCRRLPLFYSSYAGLVLICGFNTFLYYHL